MARELGKVKKIVTLELDSQEVEELYISISCRLGFIETGQVMIRAIDAERSGQNHKIKALNRGQRDLVSLLEDIQSKLLN